MFYTPKNESMNNVIAYVAPQNTKMTYIMSLNNRISCVVGISIFGFNKCWQTVFILMDLNIIPTFKQFLKS